MFELLSLATAAKCSRISLGEASINLVVNAVLSSKPISLKGGYVQTPANFVNKALKPSAVSIAARVVRAIQRVIVSRERRHPPANQPFTGGPRRA